MSKREKASIMKKALKIGETKRNDGHFKKNDFFKFFNTVLNTIQYSLNFKYLPF